ncbi:copper amine oxidase N-terminal domain-containing protein [Paenibacillus cellulosilyticus]|nr:copper amine oxidase N-terminal domain-containing protein [Paenibacillus cellulosilyticus]
MQMVVDAPSLNAASSVTDTLTMVKNSTTIVHNGVKTTAAQPLTFINGVSYIPLKAIAVEFGYKVTYNAPTKESIATSKDGVELRFKPNSAAVTKDGVATALTGPAINQQGSFMIPVKSWSILTGAKLSLVGTTMTLSWSTAPKAPTAAFEVTPTEIYAQQTQVQYVDKSVVPSGTGIVNEVWSGREDIFQEAGKHTITRQVQDGNGVWSDPYSVTIEVKAPNQAPVADFTTDKTVYRIGENILYTDKSTDDENAIESTKWSGNESVFFAAGEYPVTLEVTDRHGLTSQLTKNITVSSEVLYTRDEYNRLYTAVGEKYAISGSTVLTYPVVSYTPVSEPAQMVRSNSPETLVREGIGYEDQLIGDIRFMFHNLNNTGEPVKIYLLATNYGSVTANVGTGATGMGGPNTQVSATGKMSTARYLTSLASNPATTWQTVKPGETKEILPMISQKALKQNEVISAFADLVTDQRLEFHVVVVKDGKNPVTELPNLTYLERDVHVRGTFDGTNRSIEINETLGNTAQRLVIGDGKLDPYLTGYDGLTGNLEINKGNFGVMYKMKLSHVAPRTLISLNPRGGYYMGAFLVNGKLVTLPISTPIISDSNEAGVLYRTGNTEETVELIFMIAPGGNLPLSLMFTPLPEVRW